MDVIVYKYIDGSIQMEVASEIYTLEVQTFVFKIGKPESFKVIFAVLKAMYLKLARKRYY